MRITYRHFIRRYWKDYAAGIGLLLATNLLGASIPMLVKRAVDQLQNQQYHVVFVLLGIVTGCVAMMFGVRVASRYFLIGVGRKIEYDVRTALFNHLLGMPRSYYDVHKTGELMSNLTNDLMAFRIYLGGSLMLLFNVIFAYLTILPMMFMLSWQLTVLAFMLYPLIIGLMQHLSLKVKSSYYQVQDQLSDITAIAQENLAGINVIQTYAKETEESQRFYDASQGYFNHVRKLAKLRSKLYLLLASVSGISLLIILSEGGREVIGKGLGVSGLIAFMLYLERLAWPTGSMGWVLSSMQQANVSKDRINKVFEARPAITDAVADPTLHSIPAESVIEIKDLSFRYSNPYDPDGEKPLVLNHVSLQIQPGEMVAIVGHVGSGKTTLLSLMLRLYDPPVGSILINGIPIERFPLRVLRGGMTYMPQNSFLFSSTIRENLLYANSRIDAETMLQAAQLAQIHDEILTMPKAYDTLVGERGVTLSGGQRQRATLARTLLANAKILLLDDPFSNVDAHTEAEIIDALLKRRDEQHRTTIFASHRFSLVRQADRIIVLNRKGEVEAIGTHSQLMAQCALYRDLSRQAEESAQKPDASTESAWEASPS